MEIKKIVEGMTATEVAQVIDDNFKAAEADKANKKDVNASIAKLTETVETNKTETDAKIDSNKEETDGKLSELGSKINPLSDNQLFNDFFKEIYTDKDLSNVRSVQIAKAVYLYESYNNIVRIYVEGGEILFHARQGIKSLDDAKSDLVPYYENDGNYCVVDWSKIEDGANVTFSGVSVNTEEVNNLEFSPYIASRIQDKELSEEITKEIDSKAQQTESNVSLKINPLSDNQLFNDFFKEIYTDKDLSNAKSVQIAKAVYLYESYNNIIRIYIEGGEVVFHVRQAIKTLEDAKSDLVAYYEKDGNYCVVDWSKIEDGANVTFSNFSVNTERTSRIEFSPYIASRIQGKELSENISELWKNYYEIENENTSVVQAQIGAANYQKPTTDFVNLIIYGQSLSTGQQTCPELSRENFRGNLMVGENEWIYGVTANSRNTLSPLKAISSSGEGYIPTSSSDQTSGETPNINFANGAKKMLDGYILNLADKKMIACSCGMGGQSIELLSKNCPNNNGARFNQFVDTLNQIKSLSASEGKSLSCGCIIWMQGEYNAVAKENQGWTRDKAATNNKRDYKVYLLGGTTSDGISHNGLFNDMIENVLSIYGQENNPIVLGSQIGANYNRQFENPIDMALLEANNESDEFTLVAPTYCVTDRGGHLDSNGSRWMGEYFNKVWYNKVILGNNWKPLQPKQLKKYGTYIDIKFEVPVPPLKFDTRLVREKENYGFSVKANGANISISNINIVGDDTVRITFERELVGDVEVAYATQGVVYGNLRDSDPWVSFAEYKNLDEVVENPQGVSYKPSWEPKDENGNVIYNKKYPCHNWCMRFYYRIASNISELNIKTK